MTVIRPCSHQMPEDKRMEKQAELIHSKTSESERDEVVREENAGFADERIVRSSPKQFGAPTWAPGKGFDRGFGTQSVFCCRA
jgi:hypothetical protein